MMVNSKTKFINSLKNNFDGFKSPHIIKIQKTNENFPLREKSARKSKTKESVFKNTSENTEKSNNNIENEESTKKLFEKSSKSKKIIKQIRKIRIQDDSDESVSDMILEKSTNTSSITNFSYANKKDSKAKSSVQNEAKTQHFKPSERIKQLLEKYQIIDKQKIEYYDSEPEKNYIDEESNAFKSNNDNELFLTDISSICSMNDENDNNENDLN